MATTVMTLMRPILTIEIGTSMGMGMDIMVIILMPAFPRKAKAGQPILMVLTVMTTIQYTSNLLTFISMPMVTDTSRSMFTHPFPRKVQVGRNIMVLVMEIVMIPMPLSIRVRRS